MLNDSLSSPMLWNKLYDQIKIKVWVHVNNLCSYVRHKLNISKIHSSNSTNTEYINLAVKQYFVKHVNVYKLTQVPLLPDYINAKCLLNQLVLCFLFRVSIDKTLNLSTKRALIIAGRSPNPRKGLFSIQFYLCSLHGEIAG